MSIPESLALAVRHHQAGRLDEACQIYEAVLRQAPDNVDALHLRGVIATQQGDHERAVALLERALALAPGLADAHYNLGTTLQAQGKFEQAARQFEMAIQLRPDYVAAYNNLGLAQRSMGQLDQSLASYRRALALAPDHPEVNNNLGNLLEWQGEWDAALEAYHRSLRAAPDRPQTHNNLGKLLESMGRFEDAISCYERAISLWPDYAAAHLNLALAWLLQDEFEKGWPEYEWRWHVGPERPRNLARPRWDGRPLDGGTILLHAEQGMGDTLQFIRYVPLVRERGGRVVVECQPALVPLLACLAGECEVVGRGQPLPEFDVHAPLLSVPGIFRTTLQTIPPNVPYLFADPQRVRKWQSAIEPIRGFRVGIHWQGSPNYREDRWRSIPLAAFEPLARVPGVRLISLQKGKGGAEIDQAARRFPLLDLSAELDEPVCRPPASGERVGAAFVDTAAVMMHLDLVVACDSAVAHLAGALGIPVWIAVPFLPDWRRGLVREECPWYPTARLFRQIRSPLAGGRQAGRSPLAGERQAGRSQAGRSPLASGRQAGRGAWEDLFERMAARLSQHLDGSRPDPLLCSRGRQCT